MPKLDNSIFSFENASLDHKLEELKHLDPKKASHGNDLTVKIINGIKDIIAFFTHNNFNNSFSSSTFSTALTNANVKSIF